MLSYSTLGSGTKTSLYESNRYGLLLAVEETMDPKEDPYLDSKQIPTMGIGFDLREAGNLRLVLEEIGFSFDPVSNHQSFIHDIEEIIYNGLYAVGHDGALVDDLEEVMQRWAADPNTVAANGGMKRTRFELTESEIRVVFDQIIPRYEEYVDNWYRTGNVSQAGNSSDPTVPSSLERSVLVSFAYNSPELLNQSQSLRTALRDGNRADAWFEIRYNSNGGKSRSAGVAKRRFYESQVFGLYDDPAAVGSDEALQVYRMYTRRWKKIVGEEDLYGETPLGRVGLIGNASRIETANSDYQLTNTTFEVQTLNEILSPAARVLWDQYVGNGVYDPIHIPPANILIGGVDANGNAVDDTLNATSLEEFMPNGRPVFANDNHLLIGLEGNDTLIGGKGDNILIGGEGNDTYRIGDTGDNQAKDTSVDSVDTYVVEDYANATIEDAGGGDQYTLSSGGDVVVNDQSGDDKYTISGNGFYTINDATGSDTYRISGDGVVEIIETASDGTDTYIFNNFTGIAQVNDDDAEFDLFFLNGNPLNAAFFADEGSPNT